MSKKVEIYIPESLSDITLEQYQKYNQLGEDVDNEFLVNKMIQIFCNFSKPQLLPVNEVRQITKQLQEVLNEKPKLQQRVILGTGDNKTEFGLIPNLEKMGYGEYLDLNRYLGEWKDFHKAMAVLYRPVIKSSKKLYEIEEYEGSDKYAELMKLMPMDIVFSTVVFFWTLEKDLLQTSLHYFQNQMKKKTNSTSSIEEPNSTNNGANLTHSMNLLMEILQSFRPSLKSRLPYALPHWHINEQEMNLK